MNELILKLLKEKEVDIKLLRTKFITSEKDYNKFYKIKHFAKSENLLTKQDYEFLKGWAK